MGFYDLSKEERTKLVEKIQQEIYLDLFENKMVHTLKYFSDGDTYIRKAAYLAIGKLYMAHKKIRPIILRFLDDLMQSKDENVRQTTINSAGEIGMADFEAAVDFLDLGLFDAHHKVRNAVIGSVKKMGARNPRPTLQWARKFLNHEDKEIRREICHGIELRGRTHPQDILPLLEQLQNDPTARVRDTLVHVIGQISYKKGCLQTVIKALNTWENEAVVEKAIDEIVDVHERYQNFADLKKQQVIAYIDQNFKK